MQVHVTLSQQTQQYCYITAKLILTVTLLYITKLMIRTACLQDKFQLDKLGMRSHAQMYYGQRHNACGHNDNNNNNGNQVAFQLMMS